MVIVIDFDGTCVTNEFPKIGDEIGATPVLKELVQNGHELVLFTSRNDQNKWLSYFSNAKKKQNHLTEAINWFKERDIPLYGIQKHPKQKRWSSSPKAFGDIIIDYSTLGCPLVYPDANSISKTPYADWIEIRAYLVDLGLLNDLTKESVYHK
jgi:hypothetical protein